MIKQPIEINLRNAGLIALELSCEVGASPNQDSKQNETPQDEPSQEKNSMSALSNTTDGTTYCIPQLDMCLLSTEGNLSSHPGTEYAQIMCIPIHSFLVMVHLTLLGLGVIHKEHSIEFSLQHQHIVSFWCTVVAQTFGTVWR